MRGRHVALVTPAIAAALLRGDKTIETRFARTRRAPLGRVTVGDAVFFKLVGGPFVARGVVRRLAELADLTPAAFRRLRRRYGRAVAAPAGYWRAREHCRYAVLLWLDEICRTRRGPRIARQHGAGWVCLPRKSPCGAGTTR